MDERPTRSVTSSSFASQPVVPTTAERPKSAYRRAFPTTASAIENSMATSALAAIFAFSSGASPRPGDASTRAATVCPRSASARSTSRPMLPYPTMTALMAGRS